MINVTRSQWQTIAFLAAIMTGSTWQSAGADPLIPAPTTGTATGIYRTGLAKAGLVSVEALDSAHVWVAQTSLDGDDDAGKRFDVRVELLNDGAVVASGVQRCVGPLDLTPTEVTVPWSSFTPPAVTNGDVLALRVSTRIGTNPNDSACKFKGQASGVRVFYNSAASASRFGAQITPSPSVALYLRSSASLHEDAPNAGPASTGDSGAVAWKGGNAWKTIGTWSLAAQADCANEFIPEVRENPPAPDPETITVTQLPLPPAAPSNAAGSCSAAVNPNGTGCIQRGVFAIQTGGFLDNHHVVVSLTYSGAPVAPDPASIYSGTQVVAIKTDGTTFANGDPWKCLTCGLAPSHSQGVSGDRGYAVPYTDNTQSPPIPSILAGNNIVQCSGYAFTDEANCTPATTFIYPIRWNQQGNGGGAGGSMREIRINPDGIHLGWSKVENYTFCPSCGAIPFRKLDQFSYFGRLSFNPAPTTGTPLVPRFDLLNVSRIYTPAVDKQPFYPDPANPGELLFNPLTSGIGEFRVFSADGKEMIAINAPSDSNNIDVFATDLATGAVRRVTRNPEYIDPIEPSPDGEWNVIEDSRGSGRQLFLAAMDGIPAINDLITTGAVSSVRNNGQRRFFQTYLVDKYGDRGDYQGQLVSAEGNGGPNAINDPNWNGMADPYFSPDGTMIVYGQRLVSPPDCGTSLQDVPCPAYDDQGRLVRLMLATLEDRTPISVPPVAPVSDAAPWATPFTPGSGACVIGANQTCPQPSRTLAPAGTWTLRGNSHGQAAVTIATSTNPDVVSHVDVAYTNYSDDGINVINGTESVDRDPAATASNTKTLWHQNLTLSGCQEGTKLTSEPGGFQLTIDIFQNKFNATGTLTTTIDGTTYTQPANGT